MSTTDAGKDQPSASVPPATVVADVSKPDAAATVNLVASPAAANGDVSTAPAPAKQQPATKPSSSSAADASSTGSGAPFRGQQDDFYNTIFYFSGMGSVIGSALSEGVYVGEQYRKNAIDADDIDKSSAAWKARIGFTPGSGLNTGGRQITHEDVVIKARGQAQNLSSDFGKLQTLLESLPVFTGKRDQLPPPCHPNTVDQPIHGELYFRCKERFPVQPGSGSRATPSFRSQPSPSPFDGMSVASGTGSHTDEHTVRRRRNYDDAVLADVARAAAESFPLMPVPRPSQPGSRGSTTPVPDGNESLDQRRARRRDVNLAAQSPSPAPTGRDGDGYYEQYQHQQYGPAGPQSGTGSGVKSWQMSHVRQYDGVY